MANELLSSVMSPEAGVQRVVGGPPPRMGGPRPPGAGGLPPRMAEPPPSSSPMAKRLDTLDNKTIYLIDNGFGGGPQFMLQLQKWFARHMPSVTTIARRKTGQVFADDTTDLWDEIKAKGHAVVYGVAG